jgi:hypothetical protein
MKRKFIPRRALIYIGYCVLTTGMIIRTGDFGKKPLFSVTIVGQILAGSGLAQLLCCVMPEIVESIELQPELSHLNNDQMDLYLASVNVLIAMMGLAIGLLTAQWMVGALGYNYCFICGGILLFTVFLVYLAFCGIEPEPGTYANESTVILKIGKSSLNNSFRQAGRGIGQQFSSIFKSPA